MARFPKINLDITHRCTLQCQRCNRAIFAARNQRVPGEDMTMENFKKVINFFEQIYFCGQISDPIFNPNFITFLKMCRDAKKSSSVSTAASHRSISWYEDAFTTNPKTKWY